MGNQKKKSKDFKVKSEKKDAKPETNSLNNNMLLTTQKWKFGKAKFP